MFLKLKYVNSSNGIQLRIPRENIMIMFLEYWKQNILYLNNVTPMPIVFNP